MFDRVFSLTCELRRAINKGLIEQRDYLCKGEKEMFLRRGTHREKNLQTVNASPAVEPNITCAGRATRSSLDARHEKEETNLKVDDRSIDSDQERIALL